MISGHQVSHSKDNMSVMIQVAFSLLFVTLVRADPAKLGCRQTCNAKCGLPDPTARRVRRNMEGTHAELMDKIVGGVNANPGEYPWMVTIGKSIQRNVNGLNLTWHAHKCAGTIITKDWLLTAAQCFYDWDELEWDKKTSDWTVKLGTENYSASGVVEFHPSKIIPHRLFDPMSSRDEWDIALVKMPSAIHNFTTRINTVCLHKFGDARPSNGTKCIAAGWGLSDGKLSFGLKEVEVYIGTARGYCGAMPQTFCTGLLFGGKNRCAGDHSPLFCPVTSGGTTRYYQAGVASYYFFTGCEYVDVPYFLPWIKQIISAN